MQINLKHFIENFINLSLLRIISRVIPIIMSGYIIKHTGLSSFGILEFSKTLNYIFKLIIAYGFIYSVPKYLLNEENCSKEKIGIVLSSTLFIQMILTAFCVIISVLLVFFLSSVRSTEENSSIILFFLFVAIFSGLFPLWIYQSINKLYIVTILNTSTKLLFYLGIPLFIKTQNDIKYYPIVYSIYEFIRLLIAFGILILKFKIPIKYPNLRIIKEQIYEGWNGFCFSFYMFFYSNFPIIFLKIYIGNSAAGIFKISSYISHFTQQILEPFLQCLSPIINKKTNENTKSGIIFSTKILITISLLVLFTCLLFYFNAEHIVKIICWGKINTNMLIEAKDILKINCITTIFTVISSYIGIQILVTLKYGIYYSMSLICAGITSVFLHFVFVEKYRTVGSMISILVSEGFVLLFALSLFLYIILFRLRICTHLDYGSNEDTKKSEKNLQNKERKTN